MRERPWLHRILAALLVALGGLAVAFAEPADSDPTASPHGKVTVIVGSDRQTVTVSDLADGEARTIAAGPHEVVVTRHGDRLDVTVDGEAVAAHGFRFGPVSEGGKRVWVEREQESERPHADDDRHEVTMKWVMSDDEEADGEPVEIRIESARSDAAGEDTVMVFVGGDHPGHVAMIAPDAEFITSDRVTFRCSADGTVLRMDKDKATQERYLCPVCGRAMERSVVPHVKVLRMAAPPAPPASPLPPAAPAPPAPLD